MARLTSRFPQAEYDPSPNSEDFVVVPVPWIVARSFAWLGRFRRLSKDYEHCTKSREGVIYVASIATMLKRIAEAT